MTDVKELRDSLEKQLKDGFTGLQQKYDKASESIQKGESVTAELKSAIENQKGELQKIVDKVLEMEEKGVQLRGRQPEKKGFIDFVKDHGEYKALRESGKAAAEIEVSKGDLAAMQETKVTSAGLVVPQFDPTIQANPRQELRIRDLIPSVPVTGQSYTYFKELLHTRGAAPVAEGASKPQSNVTFEQKTDLVKKIAVWIPVSDEALDDVPQLFGYLQQLLRYDLKLEEEEQILKGDGTGNNLPGIMTQATTFTAALSKSGDTSIDTVRRAIYQVRKQAKLAADATVMTELDWMDIELQKDSQNRYLFANLQGFVTPILWGRPVITSDSMDEGNGTDTGGEFLVGNFQRGATIYDRMSFLFKVGMINDDFIKNQRALLVEERLGLAVRRNYAFVKGRFSA
ncbi:phage major capsid protein [Achromobacter marplatensis]|jgi:HK97 family phage major capsid protein|uniref:phage major capsid protein n=1 Tax=Achromobacter marplatensis TaxID=470868 RepID=UPI000277E0B7|nr:phage major capsid protein [Achromobacter marplatensis]EJO28164.1 HK97 family phage major capsid protein [Achromobacter marplatensis]